MPVRLEVRPSGLAGAPILRRQPDLRTHAAEERPEVPPPSKWPPRPRSQFADRHGVVPDASLGPLPPVRALVGSRRPSEERHDGPELSDDGQDSPSSDEPTLTRIRLYPGHPLYPRFPSEAPDGWSSESTSGGETTRVAPRGTTRQGGMARRNQLDFASQMAADMLAGRFSALGTPPSGHPGSEAPASRGFVPFSERAMRLVAPSLGAASKAPAAPGAASPAAPPAPPEPPPAAALERSPRRRRRRRL